MFGESSGTDQSQVTVSTKIPKSKSRRRECDGQPELPLGTRENTGSSLFIP